MITKKELKTNLLKLRRLASRYYRQIKIGLIIFSLLFFLLFLKTVFPYLLSGGRIIGGLASSGVSLVSQSATDLQGENGRVNFLLLGISDKEKAGAELTDTIIFLSINPQTGNAVMLSLPRDIWIASMRAKLNTAYYYGNQKKAGGGLILAKASVSEILGQPVDYGVVIDFTGFEKLIDLLGDVTVKVERSFTDEKFPLLGKEDDAKGH
jgi:LCP family protein required for cell wall assembly